MNQHYLEWNRAICERYFPEGGHGRPAYLAIDDDELAELAVEVGVEPGQAEESLSASIRSERRPLVHLWTPFSQAMRSWREKGSNGCPPYLALLGLCVLAATRMESDEGEGIDANAYYPRLKALIGEPPEVGQPDGFENVRILWEDLNRWLDQDERGIRGASTARAHPHFANIGWPLSQCLLRAADRNRLPDFFRSARLEKGTEVSDERLFELFKAWSARTRALTGPAQRLVARGGEALRQEIAQILQRELASWDGSLRDSRGRRRVEMLIRIEKLAGGRRVELSLVSPRPEGFPEGRFESEDGRTLDLETGTDGWYWQLGLSPTPALLEQGISFAKDRWAVTLDASSVVPLRTSFEQGGWLEARQAALLEEHMVLARSALSDSVEAFLGKNAETGWRRLEPKSGLPRGWALFDRVSLRSAPVEFDPELGRLIPRLNAATHLEGGLKLDPGMYLSGGEPDMWVDVGSESDAEIELPGGKEGLRPGISMVRLASHGFEPGDHSVRAAGVTRRFSTRRTYGHSCPDGAGSLVHSIDGRGAHRPLAYSATDQESTGSGDERFLVSGASVHGGEEGSPEPTTPPVVVGSAWRSYVFLGKSPGEHFSAGPQSEPEWLKRLPGSAGFQFVEFSLPFEAQFVLVRGNQDAMLVRPVANRVAPAGPPEGESPEALIWANVVLGADSGGADIAEEITEAWPSYVDVARGITGATNE